MIIRPETSGIWHSPYLLGRLHSQFERLKFACRWLNFNCVSPVGTSLLVCNFRSSQGWQRLACAPFVWRCRGFQSRNPFDWTVPLLNVRLEVGFSGFVWFSIFHSACPGAFHYSEWNFPSKRQSSVRSSVLSFRRYVAPSNLSYRSTIISLEIKFPRIILPFSVVGSTYSGFWNLLKSKDFELGFVYRKSLYIWRSLETFGLASSKLHITKFFSLVC